MKTPLYMPVLKGKAGEFQALKMLTKEAAEGILPLIDFPDVELIYPDKTPKTSLGNHLIRVCDKLVSSWGSEFYFDLYDVPLSKRLEDGRHPLNFTYEYLQSRNVDAYPVIGFDRDENYVLACKEILDKNETKVCIRLFELDMINCLQSVDYVEGLVKKLNVKKSNLLVLLDFRNLSLENVASNTELAIAAIDKIYRNQIANQFVVAASSFPESLKKVKVDTVSRIKRWEVNLWAGVLNGLKRNVDLILGDYGIVNPAFLEFDPTKMKPSAKCRYSTEFDWVVYKGHSVRNDYSQYYSLANQVFQNHEFSGENFSWGDSRIAKCAWKQGKTGNLQSWVANDTNHHVTFVQAQVSNMISKVKASKQLRLEL